MAKEVNIVDILNTSPSVALLRAYHCDIILEFLTSVLDETSAINQENFLRWQFGEILCHADS